MLDSKNNPENYKTLKIRIGTTIKNSEMLGFVPDHLKTKKMCKTSVRKFSFIIKYILD